MSDENVAVEFDGKADGEKSCTRCGGELNFLGAKTFYDAKQFTVTNYFKDNSANRPFRVFYCTTCGHMDLFVEK